MKWQVCELFEDRIKSYLEYTGGDYEELCKRYRKITIISPLFIALPIILSLFTFKLLALSSIGIGLIVYFYPLLYSWAKMEEYKKDINKEAPFISIIAYINSLLDKNIVTTLEELSNIRTLKTPAIEYQMIKKSKEVLNESTFTALERRLKLHKSDLLGKIYSKFLVASELGLSIKDRMREAMKEVLQQYKEEYKSYIERSSELAEMVFAVYLLLPIVLVGFQFTFKVNPVQLLMPLLFTPAFIFFVSTIQPSGDYVIKVKYKQLLPLFAIVPIILLPLSFLVKMAMIIVVLSLILYNVYEQVRIANYLLSQLPDMLKEISDYMKIGYSLVTAFSKVKLKGNNAGAKIINDIVAKAVMNNEIPEVETPSSLFNNIINMLGILSKTGLSSTGLEELSDLVNDIVNLRNGMLKQLRLFDVMVILTPIMLWLTFSMLGHIFSTTNSVFEYVTLFSYSLAVSLIFSKISRFVTFYLPTTVLPLVLSLILSFFPHGI